MTLSSFHSTNQAGPASRRTGCSQEARGGSNRKERAHPGQQGAQAGEAHGRATDLPAGPSSPQPCTGPLPSFWPLALLPHQTRISPVCVKPAAPTAISGAGADQTQGARAHSQQSGAANCDLQGARTSVPRPGNQQLLACGHRTALRRCRTHRPSGTARRLPRPRPPATAAPAAPSRCGPLTRTPSSPSTRSLLLKPRAPLAPRKGRPRARRGPGRRPPAERGPAQRLNQQADPPPDLAGGQSPGRAGGAARARRPPRGGWGARAWAPREGTRRRAQCPRPREGGSAGGRGQPRGAREARGSQSSGAGCRDADAGPGRGRGSRRADGGSGGARGAYMGPSGSEGGPGARARVRGSRASGARTGGGKPADGGDLPPCPGPTAAPPGRRGCQRRGARAPCAGRWGSAPASWHRGARPPRRT